jgi:hypothetical protein
MKDFSLFDESFSKDLTSSYSLFFQLSYNCLTYCIYDNYSSKYIVFKHFEFDKKLKDDSLGKKINEIIISDDILCKQFKNVRLIFNNSKSTFIPASLFDINKIESVFSFNFEISKNEEIINYHIRHHDFYILFSIPVYILKIFREWFSDIKIYHQSCSFIQHQLILNKNSNQKKVYADVNQDFIDILVLDSSNLIFYNTFYVGSDLDFVYFILNVYDKLKINPEETEIILSGYIEKDSSNYKKLNEYIKKISFNEQSESINLSYKLRDLPEHTFLNLINLVKCE